jgi:hypothetical protein
VSDASTTRAMPKSMILATPSWVMKMFAGSMSRWTIPASWACERPCRTWVTTASARATVIGGAVAVKAATGGDSGNGSGTSTPTPAPPTPPPTITGLWALSLRCQGQPTTAATANITLNQTSGGAFMGSAPGKDYDGTPFTLNISGNYTAASGQLNGQMSEVFDGGTRVDNFTTRLSSTNTGFFPATCQRLCEGACPIEIKLDRLQ